MIEIIALLVLCRIIGDMARRRERPPSVFQMMLCTCWFAGEITGAVLGYILTISIEPSKPNLLLIYICALAGAACGTAIAFLVAKSTSPLNGQQKNREFNLTPHERFQVIGISLGFLLVLGFLAWIAIGFAFPATLFAAVESAFRGGNPRMGLKACAGLVFYVIGLPVGLIVSMLGIVQGARGKRTSLTMWILRMMNHDEVRKQHEQKLQSLEFEGKLSATEKVFQSFLPQSTGWGILLGLMILAAAVLTWFALRE